MSERQPLLHSQHKSWSEADREIEETDEQIADRVGKDFARDAGEVETRKERREKYFSICLLSITTVLLFADQNLMAPNLTSIAREFGFDDFERDSKLGGEIAAVFFVLGGVVSLLIGYLTDMFSRKKLFVCVLLIGSGPCLATGWVTTFEQLFWLRAMTGVGIGGAIPLMYSMLGDWFPPSRRASAAAFLSCAMGGGMLLGQLVAGFIGGHHNNWRLPFIIISAPTIFLAFVIALTMKEPTRGGSETVLKNVFKKGMEYEERMTWPQFVNIWKIRTNQLIFLQAFPGTIPWGVIYVYLNDFMVQDKGMTVAQSTFALVVAGFGGLTGCVIGGFLGEYLYNKRSGYLSLLSGVTTILGAIPFFVLLNYPKQNEAATVALWPALLLSFVAATLLTISGPSIRVMLLNINPPETRGTVFALYNIFDDLGKGFGPVVIAVLISSFGGRLFAFEIACLFWPLCGLVLIATVSCFPSDEEKMRIHLLKNADGQIKRHSYSDQTFITR
eukprot:GILK01007223.1.p1 GENE.GILK01007223.1~~GILK01007223.1.p1  ORF type:complete len:518 (-),score=43.92 GILK01007223.1:91-1593(-)